LKGMVAKFISWNFPRLASGISPADELWSWSMFCCNDWTN
jgi:hypothetical protein